MNSGRPKPEAATAGPPPLMLEIVDEDAITPLLMPVTIQGLSKGGVTLAVTAPWIIADWEHYRNRDCLLHLADPGDQPSLTINGKISWSKLSGDGRSPLSLGLQLVRPPREAFKRLSDQIMHTSQDIKGLWERYDQVQEIPAHSYLMQPFYIAGLVLLVGGLLLQFTGSPSYKMLGWVLWLFGSLGIGWKVLRTFRQRRVSE